ncbi:cytochrome P450 [Hymenopellis radicata]|nr:cytochrome P450 [Hymenopellis radicata]
MCNASHKDFRPGRKMMLNAVGTPAALETYIRMEQHETHRFLRRVIDSPDQVQYHLRMLAGTIIMRIVYGHDVSSGRDEYVDLIEGVNADLNKAATPGNFLVDFIPLFFFSLVACFPRWFPGTGWMDTADRMRASVDEVLTKPMNLVREQLARGTARPSFVSDEIDRGAYGEKLLAWTAEALYAGGADTVVSALGTFFLCMTLFPETQAKAQQELGSVIGNDALPTWEDRLRLPFVNALIKEVLRWAPVAPQALPHSASEDGEYNGCFIPKGTIVIPNIWAFTRDPSLYADPDQFRPERFLGPSPQTDPHEFVFGFGRRVCPGVKLADSTLFLVVSNTLATLSIDKKLDPHGQPITPKVEYTGGAVVYPSKFECAIIPRNVRMKEFIMTVDDVPYDA